VHFRVHLVSIGFALLILIGVFELVRQRKLGERYAIVWLAAAVALLVLAIWQRLLTTISHALGIYYPPNAFFVVAFAFAVALLLHFSITTSRLADQARILAQRLALLEEQLRAREGHPAPSEAQAGEETRSEPPSVPMG
jgi:hypothetical protein